MLPWLMCHHQKPLAWMTVLKSHIISKVNKHRTTKNFKSIFPISYAMIFFFLNPPFEFLLYVGGKTVKDKSQYYWLFYNDHRLEWHIK